MSTITQKFINSAISTAKRSLYIKRRKTNGDFEDEWQQIDKKEGYDLVISWGEIEMAVDAEPTDIGIFNITSFIITVDNSQGYFSIENNFRSFWYGYLSRAYTKIKIVSSFFSGGFIWGSFVWGDGSKWGGGFKDIIFEGIIDQIKINNDNTATISCVSYNSILKKYHYSDLGLSGTKTVIQIYDAMMTQNKITKFFPYNAPAPMVNSTLIIDNLSGSYFEVLKTLAKCSNSVIYVNNDTIELKARIPSNDIKWNFKGAGHGANADILDISNYDDEGKERVILSWRDEIGTQVTSINSVQLNKYLYNTQDIDLKEVNSPTDRTSILNAKLSDWELNKPTINLKTKLFLSVLKPLDKITIDVRGLLSQPNTGFVWGEWKWGDGSKWGAVVGSIIIKKNETWMITKLVKDIDNFTMLIQAEKIGGI